MSSNSAVAAAFRYADKESLLLRQAIKYEEGKLSRAVGSSSETQKEAKTKGERPKIGD